MVIQNNSLSDHVTHVALKTLGNPYDLLGKDVRFEGCLNKFWWTPCPVGEAPTKDGKLFQWKTAQLARFKMLLKRDTSKM